MTPELLNLLMNAGGFGVVVYFLLRLDARMAERDRQTWALIEWLIKQPHIPGEPPIPPLP